MLTVEWKQLMNSSSVPNILLSSPSEEENKTNKKKKKVKIYRVWEHVGVLPIWMAVCHVDGGEKPITPLSRSSPVILKTVIQCPLAAWCAR